jgi:predicted AlkP superfamily pyrophosphatase or phosphodiesterase
MTRTVVVNIVGLTPRLLERPPMRGLAAWAREGRQARIRPAFPAVTCSAQTDYLTGCYPERHGIVGNGWYARDEREVKFWKQADGLVQAPRIWDAARAADPSFTCANLFWWFNMYSAADFSVGPGPL